VNHQHLVYSSYLKDEKTEAQNCEVICWGQKVLKKWSQALLLGLSDQAHTFPSSDVALP
jgi:hypothetical protein